MKRFWSGIFSLILVICIIVLAPARALAAKKQVPATYTLVQQEQIQQFLPRVTSLRDRMTELATLIEKEQWTDVRTFIHGPLGELRRRMNYLSERLLPGDQAIAKQQAKDVYGHLIELDVSAAAFSYPKSLKHYQDALVDFDAFLQTINRALS